MDTFDPRYQLEAEEPRRQAFVHQEIQFTLQALERLACRLRPPAQAPAARPVPISGTPG